MQHVDEHARGQLVMMLSLVVYMRRHTHVEGVEVGRPTLQISCRTSVDDLQSVYLGASAHQSLCVVWIIWSGDEAERTMGVGSIAFHSRPCMSRSHTHPCDSRLRPGSSCVRLKFPWGSLRSLSVISPETGRRCGLRAGAGLRLAALKGR
jgi:hypothetical protein